MHSRPDRSIELDEDMTFQRRMWTAERVGWVGMVLIIIAAALGLFSVGPLSSTTARQPQGLAEVEYGRFARQSAPGTIKIEIAPSTTGSGDILVEADRSFLEVYKITSIQPRPAQATTVGDGIRFRFDASQGMPARVLLYVEPQRIGFFRPKLTIGGGDPIELPVFIYP